jgi:putative phosphonate metabolism protein
MSADAALAAWPAHARFAVYYAPPRDSAWWPAGCAWLGRDPESGAVHPPPQPAALARPLAAVTAAPARYGWHGTLMPPFRLAEAVTPAELLVHARGWAAQQSGFLLEVDAAELGRFIALRPADDMGEAAMRALAASALRAFTPLRAMPSAHERDARRTPSLTPRQHALLDAWGYPYVLDEFRFHMTLSDSLDTPAERAALLDWWRPATASLGPLPITGAALFVETEPGAPFTLWQRLPFITLRAQA